MITCDSELLTFNFCKYNTNILENNKKKEYFLLYLTLSSCIAPSNPWFTIFLYPKITNYTQVTNVLTQIAFFKNICLKGTIC